MSDKIHGWRFDLLTWHGWIKPVLGDWTPEHYYRQRAACPTGHDAPAAWCYCGIHFTTSLEELLSWLPPALEHRDRQEQRDLLLGAVSRWELETVMPRSRHNEVIPPRLVGEAVLDPPSTVRARRARLVGPVFIDAQPDKHEGWVDYFNRSYAPYGVDFHAVDKLSDALTESNKTNQTARAERVTSPRKDTT
ncbi:MULTISPECIES: hypothetical protein [Dermacoccus]|uniref:Uncharacterized protein n=2 Tax=Dermacoccus TaxID=57495 RepID=A0A417Z957_9MICO|nr:hypothetical protein [Dermacoccus abyssi]RHW47178.1 hypothetical protein D1832_04140 [Dermacoccus abyssi]